MGTEDKACEKNCTPPSIKVHRCVSILPNDYNIMENKPVINGVVLEGEQTAKTLSLLSSNVEEYESVTLNATEQQDGYLVVLMPGDAQPKKVALSDLRHETDSERGFQTVDEIDPSAAIGSYQFVEKK